VLPCVIFEDEHLLVVNKPAGWNTHAPAPHAGEGIYDWLRHREPRWHKLAILHRLDKDTSGVLAFGKTASANRSLTRQFTERAVRKRYVFLTHGSPPKAEWTARDFIARSGSRYVSGPKSPSGEEAETRFRVLSRDGDVTVIAAEPRTGRTHQIRVQAADSGVPVLGDTLYKGEEHARLCLHAESLSFTHPASSRTVTFDAPAAFGVDARVALRSAIIESDQSDACRLIHGAADGRPGWRVDRLGAFLLSQAESDLDVAQRRELDRLAEAVGAAGLYHKRLSRQVRHTAPDDACPQFLAGRPAPDRFTVMENGVRFELSFQEGYSVGLFLDQRDNRRRLLTGHVAAGFPLCHTPFRAPHSPFRVLNLFAYTCAFSVCAAQSGAQVTSLDLSRKYLDWGRRNFELNRLDPAAHDFIYGDAFDWLARLAKKGRRFEAVLLDPPTFSQSKQSGVFRVEKDCGKLVRAAAGVLEPGGILFASTNAATWAPEAFLAGIREAAGTAKRRVRAEFYAPQPPDFPVSRAEPAYLKTVWMQLD